MKKKWGALIFGAVLVLAAFAAAAPARDITSECTMLPGSKKKEFKKAMDGNYRTYWNSYAGEGAAIQVTVPEGEEASGVWLQWYEHEHAVAVQVKDEQGEWAEYGRSEGIFLSDYLPLPEGTKEFRIANPAGEKKSPPMPLAEIHVYGQGELPPEVQVWQKPAEKADLMLVAGHPDDEILWFGGILPRYAGVEKKAVQVCIMVPTLPRRRLEELDGLWTCGVKNYPVFGHFRDFFSLSLKDQYKRWDKTVVYRTVTGWIRRFQPEVVITHDIKGEYGHGAHRACADAVIQGLELAADEKNSRIPMRNTGHGMYRNATCTCIRKTLSTLTGASPCRSLGAGRPSRWQRRPSPATSVSRTRNTRWRILVPGIAASSDSIAAWWGRMSGTTTFSKTWGR